MQKPVSSQPDCPGELNRMPVYSARVAQHQEYTCPLVHQINQIISHSADAETVLQQTAQAVGEAFQVAYCLITVAAENQVTNALGCWHSSNLPMLQSQQLLALEQLGSVMETDAAPLAIDDIQAIAPKIWPELPLPLAVGAVLLVPTRFQGRINGALRLIRSQPYHWSESEVAGATAAAAAVAIAISQVGQTTLLASLQQQVRTSAQYKALIEQLTIANRGALEPEQILQLALTGAAQALEVNRGLLLTLKYADPLLRSRERRSQLPKAKVNVVCTWSSDSQIEPPASQSFWLAECRLCQQAFAQSPHPIAISNKNSLAAIAPTTEIAQLLQLPNLCSLLMFPLENQGTVLGFLVLQQPGDRLWHPEELKLVKLVSALVSTSIIQSQTLRQVQSLVDERTAQLQRSLEVQGKLYEKTRQQIDQLRQLNRLKDEFVSTMNHELRTPLTSMSLAIRMLRQPGLSPERQARYLDILEQQCNQEINLVHDLLKLQELETNKAQLKLETIDLRYKIQDMAQVFTAQWVDQGLTLSVELPTSPLLVQTDSESIERILQELLTNAGKYSNPDTNIVLRAAPQVYQQANQVVLSLTNIGPGIAPEDLDSIFDKFRRGQGVTQQAIQGTGLGLALVKCLVQHLNGTIDVSSITIDDTATRETCFTLTLPQFFAPPTIG